MMINLNKQLIKYYKIHKGGKNQIIILNKHMTKIQTIVLHLNYLIEKKTKIIVDQ